METITTIIPVSPAPSHPDTVVLDMTIDSIRERLPDTEIILMFDGVAPTLEHLRIQYEEFISRMLWQAEHKWGNVLPLVFPDHKHQTLMTVEALTYINTPVLLWSEMDTPLVNEIPFDDLVPVIINGQANVIRFSHEALVLEPHEFLMLDRHPIDVMGQPFIRTRQWSGRPHLASVEYYRRISAPWVTSPEPWGGRRFIEHIMYGHVEADPFEQHKVFLYAPEAPYPDGTYVRSLHTDGRRYGAAEYDPSVSSS
jgi:hypothetical protein